MNDQVDLTQQILQDVLAGAPFNAYGVTPLRSVAQAYALQDSLTAALVETDSHGPVAGWKIAANSVQLMERFKLTEPATGRVFSNQRHNSPATLKVGDYTEFAFEPEIVAVLKTTLPPENAPFSTEDVIAAIDRFAPGMELLDMRQTDMPNTHIPDAIAQNISNVGAVLGGPGIAPENLTPDSVRTVITIDGKAQHDATGAAPQNPIEAVTWLANHLASRGLMLEAGQIVMCGTHSPIWYHKGAGEIEVQMSGLGTVSVTMA
nr:fumarylacetoacetate hydrolase family protein [Amylibacter sp.]